MLGRLLAAACLAGALMTTGSASARPLHTAVFDDAIFLTNNAAAGSIRARQLGATFVRIGVWWRAVAPTRPERAADPADPAYRWDDVDRAVRAAASNRVQPILSLHVAPAWAEGEGHGPQGTNRPDPVQFGAFARAAATRYSGAHLGLPRVRYWQAWNEPNISLFLNPQYVGRTPFSPAWYRQMVNAFAESVHAVHGDNVVVAGGTAPFRDITPAVQAVNPRWGPLTFMRELLCLDRSLRRKCSSTIRFDVWAHHPYTSGGPTRHAILPDDVSLGDLPEMRRVLQAGVRARTITSRRAVEFWVTEFSWDSNPPDPKGVPLPLQARWVAEGLYRMWAAGVSLVTWFSLRDDPLNESFYQSSLFRREATFAADRPKPAHTAFRFPLFGERRGRSVYVWGRTPSGRAARVIIEQTFRGGWRQLAVLRTDRNGIFQRSFRGPTSGSVRATLLGTRDRSLAFSLRRVPDWFFNPFGQETILEGPLR